MGSRCSRARILEASLGRPMRDFTQPTGSSRHYWESEEALPSPPNGRTVNRSSRKSIAFLASPVWNWKAGASPLTMYFTMYKAPAGCADGG